VLEAAAQVLVEEGYDRASTNRIAKVAGVSVGSLYQYFPSKEALVIALFRRHSDEMLSLLEDCVTRLWDEPLDVAVRTYVQSMLAAHRLDPELHRALVQQVLHLGLEHVRQIQERAAVVVRAYLERHKAALLPKDLDMAAYLLVSCVESATHAAILGEAHHRLADPSLEEELVALILRYLTGSSPKRRR
jgi:AcrR family transcriptional regulator